VVSRAKDKDTLEPEVDLLVSFVNTRDVESGFDAFADREGLASWVEERTGEDLPEIDEEAAARLKSLRESLRALLRGNNGGEVAEEDLLPLREAAERSRYRPSLGGDGQLSFAPTRSDLGGFEARLLLAIERIQSHGVWPRLKACPDQDCEWAFYDGSRNRSRTWCSMEVCGNRDKTRRYRRRKGD
jgi:predicted RNA-binding Zn ribbon-like protein